MFTSNEWMMSFAIGEGIQNILWGQQLDTDIIDLNPTYCEFTDSFLESADIVSITAGSGNQAVVLGRDPDGYYELHQVQLFNSTTIEQFNTTNDNETYACSTTQMLKFNLQPVNSNYSSQDVILGCVWNHPNQSLYCLHGYYGMIIVNNTLNTTNNTQLIPTPKSPVALAPYSDSSTNVLFLLVQQPTANLTMTLYSFNRLYQNFTSLGDISVESASNGLLGYDSLSSTFVVKTKQTVALYSYKSGTTPPLTLLHSWNPVPWIDMSYYSGLETPFCPLNCNSHGTCVNGLCQCDSGWSATDCSMCPDSYCNSHGKCAVLNNNRTCTCNYGWDVDPNYCTICDPQVFCSGNGECYPDKASHRCQCDKGFSGVDCSICNSAILCNNNGKCTVNGTCECDKLWVGSDCSEFNFPLKSIEYTVEVINYVTLVSWASLFLLACMCLILRSMTPLFRGLAASMASGVQMSLVYFSSFALLMDNSLVQHVSYQPFRFYYLFMADIHTAFLWQNHWWLNRKTLNDNSIWLESSMFNVKCILFILSLLVWKLNSRPGLKGFMLQLALWFHFSFVVSIFQKFQQKPCEVCSKASYSIPTTLVAVLMMFVMAILFYRLWKMIASHYHFFEQQSTKSTRHDEEDEYAAIRHLRREQQQQETESSSFFPMKQFIMYLFYPPSQLISFVFARVKSPIDHSIQTVNPVEPNTPLLIHSEEAILDADNNNNNNGNSPALHTSPQLMSKMKKLTITPDTPVEDFIAAVAKKIDHEDMDSSKIIAMLKGNWYTTVADLKTLTAPDAEKLNIPYRLFKAMQQELPKSNNTEVYTVLDSLVRTVKKENFLLAYGCLTEEYQVSLLYFKLDELLIRNMVWIIIAVALWQQPMIQLVVLGVFQLWWILFLLWNRPYRTNIIFAVRILTEIALFIIVILLIDLAHNIKHFYSLLFVSLLHLFVVGVAIVLPFVILVYQAWQRKHNPAGSEDDERNNSNRAASALLKKSIRSYSSIPSSNNLNTSVNNP